MKKRWQDGEDGKVDERLFGISLVLLIWRSADDEPSVRDWNVFLVHWL